MDFFSIKDALDILLVATLLFYLYRLMKESGAINIFYGVIEALFGLGGEGDAIDDLHCVAAATQDHGAFGAAHIQS